MSNKYRYFQANAGCSALATPCVVCEGEVKNGYLYLDNETREMVAVCSRQCGKAAEQKEYSRNTREVFYRIESGWDENPIWSCPVTYLPEEAGSVHLHTTPAVGEPPAVCNNAASGLFFKAHGSLWPIEAREGELVLVVWENDQEMPEKSLTPEEAIAILR